MEPSDDRSVPLKTLLRWSEALAGIARTGLGFTESLYERSASRRSSRWRPTSGPRRTGLGDDPDHAGGLVQEWMDTVGKGVPGYVTPKVAVGAAVGNDKGELLLIQRADSGIWLYPTGWCDVGYSAAEVVVKEVEEETGIIVEPVRLIAVLDGLRLGFTRVPLYSLLFYCRAIGGELHPHPLETRDVGWFTRDDAAAPRSSGRSAGASTSSPPSTASAATCSTTACASRCGAATPPTARDLGPGRRVGRRRPGGGGDRPRAPAVPLGAAAHARAAGPHRGRPRHHAVRGGGRAGGSWASLTLVAFEIPTGRRAWIEDVVTDAAARGKGVASALVNAALAHAAAFGARTVDLTSRPDREDANRLYVALGFEQRHDERLPLRTVAAD